MNFDEIYKDYYEMFGELPPFSPDDNYYDEEFAKKVQDAISSGVKING